MIGEFELYNSITYCPYHSFKIGDSFCKYNCKDFQNIYFYFNQNYTELFDDEETTFYKMVVYSGNYYCIVECMKENKEKITKLLEEIK